MTRTWDMDRKGGWFTQAVKKVLSSDSKKDQKNHKLNTPWLGGPTDLESAFSSKEASFAVAPPLPSIDTEEENEKSKYAYSVAPATVIAVEAVVATEQVTAEVVPLTIVSHYPGKTKEEIAAIKIQTTFRGYLARRALRALRGLMRLKTLVQGNLAKQQASNTLRCMQTLSRVQSQIRERRIRMFEENRAIQWQLQKKHEKEVNKLQAAVGEEWDDSKKSKDQIKARLLDRKEAAKRRERARAYAFSHQQTWKNPSKSAHAMFMVNNPQWGWSWLERWMASRPWEIQGTINHNDHAYVEIAASCAMSIGEITKLYSLRDHNQSNKSFPTNQKASRPPSRCSNVNPASRASSLSSASRNARPPSLKGNASGSDDDSRSMFSTRSERHRRHSIAGSLVTDDESLASSPAMTPKRSAKAKSRIMPSPSSQAGKGSVISAKKQLSSGSKRHSCPPKVEIFPEKDAAATITGEEKMSNRGSR